MPTISRISGAATRGWRRDGGDWVSFHRHAGQDDVEGSVIKSRWGTSEAPMRNQFRAWVDLMARA